MFQPSALLPPPPREPVGEALGAVPATAPVRTQSREDACLAERVQRALRATGYRPLQGLEVSVQAEHICLGGRVPSYYLKQVAQATALAVSGAYHVRNDLEVGRPA
jgi:osmotically-inducible protein OsmY